MRALPFALGLILASAVLVPAASAEEAGDTSGPASGTTVKPSTAVQKEKTKIVPEDAQSTQGGAAGTEAKPGSEGGEAPKK